VGGCELKPESFCRSAAGDKKLSGGEWGFPPADAFCCGICKRFTLCLTAFVAAVSQKQKNSQQFAK